MAITPTILFVEDDKDFQDYVFDLLTKNGLVVQSVAKGTQAVSKAEKQEPDLVLLDLNLPDMTGEAVCTELKKMYPNLPIIMLTAKNSVSEKVEGFNLGADDYITKPFEPEELIARIKARLRQNKTHDAKLKIADLEMDTKKVLVTRAGKEITLTPHEFRLLEFLMNNKGVVLSREMILNRIWSYSYDVESRVVDVYMGYLRKKIDSGQKKKLIYSIRGFGYTIKD
jgi:DNA-binding response OmpR family regulator